MNSAVYKFLKDIQLRLRIIRYGSPSLKVVIGSGGVFEKGWVPTNMETINATVEADWLKYFKPNSIDIVMGEHVWEHLSPADSATTARIIYKFLKPNGRLRIAVPDGLHPDPKYIKRVDIETNPERIHLPEAHKVLYTYKTITSLFESIGFKVNLLEYYDEKGEFHATNWDPADGKIYRSKRFKFERKDVSILGMPNYTSLIVDAVKS